MRRRTVLLAVIALLVGGPPLTGVGISAGAAPVVATAAGTIASGGPGAFVVTTAAGPTRVKTTPETRVLARFSTGLRDIKVGDLVGIAARKEADGSLTAVSISILPGVMRAQFRQGQFPMDNGNVMTNATVIETVSRVSGRILSLAYAGGTAAIMVPPDAQIHRLVLTTRSDLKPGARVTVSGTANGDGSLTATSVTVEEGRSGGTAP